MAKKNKRNDGYLSIRKKLIAAIAMLLVASFMVASSSYAWFTLSTAPEVKGIQTAVGANGSLEIALRVTESLENISSNVGDSGNYTTWGNLVDLSDPKFGLNSIFLMPARLNKDANGFKSSNPLRTPIYGADGRIEKLNEGAMIGSYNTTDSAFKTYDSTVAAEVQTQYGVRAIGNSTSLTPQQSDYNNAKVAAGLAITYARNNASNALTTAGSGLANIAVDKAMGSTTYDITCAETLHSGLTAAVEQLDAAILAFIKADFAKDNESLDEQSYNSAKETYFANSNTADGLGTLVSGVGVQALTDAWTLRNHIDAALTSSKTAYNNVTTKTAANATELSNVLTVLVDLDNVTINGFAVDDVKENLGTIASQSQNIVIELSYDSDAAASNHGVYVNMAKIVGNFDVPVTIDEVTYNAITLKDVKAKMKTAVSGAPTVQLVNSIPAAPTSSGNANAVAVLNDVYGYMLDFAFRTNASGSTLMLQTSATDRIYSSGGSQATQGGGSTMSFTGSATFNNSAVKALMQGIRIVFIDETGAIQAIAGLNTAVANESGYTVTAPIQIYDATTYEITNEGVFKAKDGQTIAFATPDAKGATSLNKVLNQNKEHAMSVLVYLDGDYVTNKLVANDAYSMMGTMNLQFSSSAELKPMSYAPLQETSDAALNKAVPSVMTTGSSTMLPATVNINNSTKTVTSWAVTSGDATKATDTNTLTIGSTTGNVVLTATFSDSTTATYTIQVVQGATTNTPAQGGGDTP